jgi:hypothetical protein
MIITLEDNALIADINKARREYANGETIILHALLVKHIAPEWRIAVTRL